MTAIVGMDILQARLSALGSPAAQQTFMQRVALRTQAALQLRVPRKTGFTGRTIKVGAVTPTSAEVIGSIVVKWIDEGTGLYGPLHHRICPRSKKALSWTAGTFGPRGSLRLSGRRRKGKAGLGASRVTVRSIAGMKARPFVAVSVRDAAQKSGLAETAIDIWRGAA